jgi:putative transposase
MLPSVVEMFDEYRSACPRLVLSSARQHNGICRARAEHDPDLFTLRGIPGHIRPDNGPEFVAKAVQEWIAAVGAKTAYIERGSPWENGYIESFNARLRDELLDGKIFYSLQEARTVIESWRRHYNTIRPHASLGYKPPAPEVFVPALGPWPAALRRVAPPATLAQRPTLN